MKLSNSRHIEFVKCYFDIMKIAPAPIGVKNCLDFFDVHVNTLIDPHPMMILHKK